MENLKYKMVFMDFYSAIMGSFYSPMEKERILRLIAIANGVDAKEISEVIKSYQTIENEGIDNPVSISNYLLTVIFRKDLSPILYNAVTALYEIFNSGKGKEAYSNETLWRRSILRGNNQLDVGYYEYALGKHEKAIDAFEKLKKSNKKLPITEYLAQICFETKCYQKAYEYALEAQCIQEGERVYIPWLTEIENICKEKLSSDEAERIEKEVLNKKNTPSKIGF